MPHKTNSVSTGSHFHWHYQLMLSHQLSVTNASLGTARSKEPTCDTVEFVPIFHHISKAQKCEQQIELSGTCKAVDNVDIKQVDVVLLKKKKTSKLHSPQ